MPVKVHFLGTNGWYSSKTGNTTCVLIDAPEAYVVCDAGNGIQHIDKYIKNKRKPVYLFLSHFHIDHISGLHIMNKFRFPQGMKLVCFKGGKKILDAIMRQPFTISHKDLPMNVSVKEIEEGSPIGFPFKLTAKETKHIGKCFGYRFEFKEGSVSYCLDTGYCQNVVKLSSEVDLMITECAYRSGHVNEGWPHLNPELAAQM